MKPIKVILFILILHNNLTAQEQEVFAYLKFGSGAYFDLFGATRKDPYTGLEGDNFPIGTAMWIEGGYKLKNNIIISGNILFAFVNYEYTDLLYQGSTYFERIQNYTLNFSYELGNNSRHKFIPCIGILYNKKTPSKAIYIISQTPSGDLILSNFEVSSDPYQEIGLNLNLDYHYQFKNNFFIGARINTVYLLSVSSLESIVFSPIIGVKF